MPLALFWEPLKPGTKIAPDADNDGVTVLRKLNETFGPAEQRLRPVELSKPNIFTLRQMGGKQTVFGAIADLIAQHGSIRVWGRE